ncbi:MAG: hypothetical protein ABI685_08370, partial [Ferruginibacter sp.]
MKSIKQNKLTFFIFFLISMFLFNQQANAQVNKAEEAKQEKRMLDYLEKIRVEINNPNNSFAPEAKLRYIDSMLPLTKDPSANLSMIFKKANTLLEAGREQDAVKILERIATFIKDVPASRKAVMPSLGVAYLRLAERNNCINNHSADACIMPIQGKGIHQDKLPA